MNIHKNTKWKENKYIIEFDSSEMLIYYSREKIMEARTFLEKVIEDSDSKIKETNVFLARIKYYQKRNEKKELNLKNES